MTENAGEVVIASINKNATPEALGEFFAAAAALSRVGKALGLKYERKRVGEDRYALWVGVLTLTALKEDAQ